MEESIPGPTPRWEPLPSKGLYGSWLLTNSGSRAGQPVRVFRWPKREPGQLEKDERREIQQQTRDVRRWTSESALQCLVVLL